MSEYLLHRPNLLCVFALLDSGVTPQVMDLEFVEWLARNSVPFVLVFTKTDKVSATVAQTNIAAFSEHIAQWCEQLPEIFTCSAKTREGPARIARNDQRGDCRTGR